MYAFKVKRTSQIVSIGLTKLLIDIQTTSDKKGQKRADNDNSALEL